MSDIDPLQVIMDQYGDRLGQYYIERNNQLQADPAYAVPVDVERRAVELIQSMTGRTDPLQEVL